MEDAGENECNETPVSPVRRPMNAFLIFCKRHRTIIRNKNPNMDNRNVTRILGELWAKLPPDEKKVYTDLAQQYKDAFMKANPEYKWYNPEKSSAPSKPTTRPSNASRHVTVLPRKYSRSNDVEDTIKPGKLADPTNMGGLNLLLIAGEEALKGPRTILHRTDCIDTCNGNGQINCTPTQKMEPPSTEAMASIVTSEMAYEQSQRLNDNPSLYHGQEVVDHVIEQLYFSQRCRVNSGDSVNNNRLQLTNSHCQSEPAPLKTEPQGFVSPPVVNYSPKKEFQYRWRSMSASGQLESFKRFQASMVSNMSRSHEIQNFQEVEMITPPNAEESEKMDEGNDGAANHEAESVWKSPRANRGKRYKEMMSEGLLQKHHPKRGSFNSESDEEANTFDADFLPDTKKAAARKRTVSESETKAKNGAAADKRYKTGDFDLDAEIASLTPCAMDSVCKKKSSRQHTRMRHHSEGSKRQPNFSFSTIDKVFTVGELHCDRLLCSPVPLDGSSLTGSQKRKARKSSITHLIQVPSLENIADDLHPQVPSEVSDINPQKQSCKQQLKDSPTCQPKASYTLPTLTEMTRTKIHDLGMPLPSSSQMCFV